MQPISLLSFFQNLLTASIHGSVVILAVLLLRLVLRRTPRKYICLLWLLAGIRLLLPIEVRSDLSLQPAFTLTLTRLTAFPWAKWLPWIWGAVACGFAVYSLVSYWRLKKKVREAVRIRGGWECDRIDTAFILGFIKPKIYIPMGMTPQFRQHILAHERTHLDKGDHWIKMIGFLALALHWFNPLVWIAYSLLCKDIEMACDERVVQFMELPERKSYSAALLSCSSNRAHFGASPVAFGEVSVKKRILSVLHYKKPGFWISLLGVLAFFFVALCLLTSPNAAPEAEVLTPEQQAQQARLAQCRSALEAMFDRQEFYYDITGTDSQGSVLWMVQLSKSGADTLWKRYTATSEEMVEGRMERGGRHYAWYEGQWVETGEADSRFADWLSLFLWDTGTDVEEPQDGSQHLCFTTQWEGTDATVHTSTFYVYCDSDGSLTQIRVEQPKDETAARAYLQLDNDVYLQIRGLTVADLFAQAEEAIGAGTVSGQELADQVSLNDWGIFFRVDDDRLSDGGADVAYAQEELGHGTISTTEAYWLERKENGVWEQVPTIAAPKWESGSIGLAKGNGTVAYLDWTPIYGRLMPGEYRMGKNFHCYDRETNSSRDVTVYSEFRIYESVATDSSEAKAAVEHCYAKLEALKQKKTVHWVTVMGENERSECWVDGEDSLRVTDYPGPEIPKEQWSESDLELFPRTDVLLKYDGVGYDAARAVPGKLNSDVVGVELMDLSANRGAYDWNTIAGDMLFFERGNHAISFPDGIGVVSDKMVRFQTNWNIAGGMACSAVLTYQFDDNGDLNYLEYKTDLGTDNEHIYAIIVQPDTDREIREKIDSAARSLVVQPFSWQEAQEKYTADAFNIRQDSFVNTQPNPITGPVDAARLALKEYPKLGNNYLSIRAFRDRTAGMWKVTVKAYAEYQATVEYRDVYLSDSGLTKLLVYEGPLDWDEERK